MTPELRAIADRFIYEQATVKHIANLAPEGALARPVPGLDWNVGQLLAHLATCLSDYATVVRRWLAGEDPLAGFDPDAMNAERARANPAPGLAELMRVFGEGLNGLFGALSAVPDSKMGEPFGDSTPLEVLGKLGEHYANHAIALIDALPEARMDALVLNWVLELEFEDEASRAWQARLLADAREYIATHPEDPEEDEDE